MMKRDGPLYSAFQHPEFNEDRAELRKIVQHDELSCANAALVIPAVGAGPGTGGGQDRISMVFTLVRLRCGME